MRRMSVCIQKGLVCLVCRGGWNELWCSVAMVKSSTLRWFGCLERMDQSEVTKWSKIEAVETSYLKGGCGVKRMDGEKNECVYSEGLNSKCLTI